MNRFTLTIALASLAPLSPAAHAQLQVDWYTIDGGGGASAGAGFSLTGTIGQPDAAAGAGGPFQCGGGFWGAIPGGAGGCYPNCDQSTTSPILNIQDFTCFLNRFSTGDTYANCDSSTAVPTLNIQDFICFLNKFAAGCP